MESLKALRSISTRSAGTPGAVMKGRPNATGEDTSLSSARSSSLRASSSMSGTSGK